MSATPDFRDDLIELGFELVQATRGSERFVVRPTQHLQLWVQTHGDGTASFTWEFALGEYLKQKGFAVSVQDELSLMIFPRSDARGPAEVSWISAQIEQTEASLSAVDFLARS